MTFHFRSGSCMHAAVLVGNLGGVTGLLLGADGGKLAARLRLDLLIPVRGFKRCVDYDNGYGEPWGDRPCPAGLLHVCRC